MNYSVKIFPVVEDSELKTGKISEKPFLKETCIIGLCSFELFSLLF